MLVRQAISFSYRGQPTGGRTELGSVLANILLRDYAKALGIDRYEGDTGWDERDYARISCYSMEWQVPDKLYDELAECHQEGSTAFKYTPAIGRVRPRLCMELLEGMEVQVDLGELVNDARRFLGAVDRMLAPEGDGNA